MNELEEINKQILELTNRQRKIVENNIQAELDEFLTFEWTKETKFYFRRGLDAAGLRAFYMEFSNALAERITISKSIRVIYGNDSLYERNLVLAGRGFSRDWPAIETDNHQLLMEFIEKYNINVVASERDMEIYEFLAIRDRMRKDKQIIGFLNARDRNPNKQ